MSLGDINRVLNSFNNNEVFEYLREVNPELISGKVKPLDSRISDLKLEVLMEANFLSQGISLSLATLPFPFCTKNKSSLTYINRGWPGDLIVKYTFEPEVRVWMPLRAGISYPLLALSIIQINVNGGVDFHFAKFSQNYKYEAILPSGDQLWYRNYIKAHQLFFGLNGGVELELSFTKNIALVVEAEGRFGKLRNMKGSIKHEHKYGLGPYEKGTLYFFNRWDSGIEARYSELSVYKKKPKGLGRSNIRKAIMDLSGYSLRVGTKIKLF
ncbi:MAG: hypothetical protein ACE5GI_08000 [Candidatus Aminicenantales bacterium]